MIVTMPLKPKRSRHEGTVLKVSTASEGEDRPHLLLWAIVEEQAALANGRERDWSHPALVAMVFAFHALEAYLNFVGERLAPEIWENERDYFRSAGFDGKLRKVMDLVGLPWTPGTRPLQTVLGLKRLRDLIAHGRAERKESEVVHPAGSEAPYLSFTLRSLFTPKTKLPRAIQDVEQLADQIHVIAASNLAVNDAWFGDRAFRGPQSHSFRDTTPPK
jgi:hypothetical protein